jgi:hypothetical protein
LEIRHSVHMVLVFVSFHYYFSFFFILSPISEAVDQNEPVDQY